MKNKTIENKSKIYRYTPYADIKDKFVVFISDGIEGEYDCAECIVVTQSKLPNLKNGMILHLHLDTEGIEEIAI